MLRWERNVVDLSQIIDNQYLKYFLRESGSVGWRFGTGVLLAIHKRTHPLLSRGEPNTQP
ncbi:MAG: hypothetical protein JWP37_776 [Mucilaginibacter sp.]|nr:hypothetical protein [Mucilaginibacter sp.]